MNKNSVLLYNFVHFEEIGIIQIKASRSKFNMAACTRCLHFFIETACQTHNKYVSQLPKICDTVIPPEVTRVQSLVENAW